MTKIDRTPVAMRSVRFVRTVKRDVAGMGMTLNLMLEARIPVTYDADAAVLDVIVRPDHSLKMTLNPAPEPIMITDNATTQVEMAMPATETVAYDPNEIVEAEKADVEKRAVDLLMPSLVKPTDRRAGLLTGSQMQRSMPALDKKEP